MSRAPEAILSSVVALSMRVMSGSASSSRNLSFSRRMSIPSSSMVTEALRLPPVISASSPNPSPTVRMASWMASSFGAGRRETAQRPEWTM